MVSDGNFHRRFTIFCRGHSIDLHSLVGHRCAAGKESGIMKFRWSLAPPQPLLAGRLATASQISPLLAQCLLNRGYSEPAAIENFLQPRLKNLADPFLLPNMAIAVERLLRAREIGRAH